MSMFDSTLIYPWRDQVESQLNYLRSIAVPPALNAALQALIKSGTLIMSELANGYSVASDDAKQWLAQTQQFATHLSATLAAPINQTAAAGLSTPDDSNPLGPIVAPIVSPVGDALAELEAILADLEALPWGWILFAAALTFVLPPMLRSLKE